MFLKYWKMPDLRVLTVCQSQGAVVEVLGCLKLSEAIKEINFKSIVKKPARAQLCICLPLNKVKKRQPVVAKDLKSERATPFTADALEQRHGKGKGKSKGKGKGKGNGKASIQSPTFSLDLFDGGDRTVSLDENNMIWNHHLGLTRLTCNPGG